MTHFWKKKTLGAALAAAATAALVMGVGMAPASAAVTWSSSSLTTVYDPTGAPDANGDRLYYAYAPSVVQSGSMTRIWTCHNSQSGVIEDDIFATTITSGSIVSDTSVLTKSSAGWDSFHICDPSVIRVNSVYNGVAYTYAMFYLGNDQNASAHNQVGVAYANSLDGPWVKYPNPLVTFAESNTSLWGAGQPSATTIDAASGTAMLFWVEGYGAAHTTKTYRAQVDLDGTSGPVVGSALQVTASGLTSSTGGSDWLNNADFAYDPSRDRFYAVREQHPYPSTNPDYIGSSLQVVSIAGSSIWGGGGSWTVEANITPSITGFGRNHNAGIVRTEYGTLPSSSDITVVFTTSCGDCSTSLWEYELHQVTGAIS